MEESIQKIAQIGYEGIEILCDVPHAYPPLLTDEKIKKIKSIISSFNLQISNLNAFTLFALGDVYHPSWIETSEGLRENRVKHTIDCIHLAKKLGARNLSTEPGGPVDYFKNYEERGKALNLFTKGLERAAKIAETNDVKILVEPEPTLLIENSSEFLDLMRKICSDYVRLNFDIGHFYCVGEDPAQTVNKLFEYIDHFHLADIASNRIHNHLLPGLGSINFSEVFKAIKENGYKGFITVELYPYQDNPVEAACSAYNYLKNKF